jgi:hypothetical protein
MDEKEKLEKLMGNQIFNYFKKKATDFYNRFGNMSLKESYAYGIMKALEWVIYNPEGRDWLFLNHPILKHKETYLAEYIGKQTISPDLPDIAAKELRIMDGKRRTPGKESNNYYYTGSIAVREGEIFPLSLLHIQQKQKAICSNKDCENHTDPKWCVMNYNGTFICNYCAGQQNQPGANISFCRKHKEACIEQGCQYAQAYLPMHKEV